VSGSLACVGFTEARTGPYPCAQAQLNATTSPTQHPPQQNPNFFIFTYLHQFLIFWLETMGKYQDGEKNLDDAIEYKKKHPDASFRWLEGQFKVKKDKINRRWLKSQNPR
jgi:hypothetical protein